MIPEEFLVQMMSSTTSSSMYDKPATVTTTATLVLVSVLTLLGSTTMQGKYLVQRTNTASYNQAATLLATLNVTVTTSPINIVVVAGQKRSVYNVLSKNNTSRLEHFNVLSCPPLPVLSSSSLHHQQKPADDKALALNPAAINNAPPPAGTTSLVPFSCNVIFSCSHPLCDHPDNV